jgi:trehalose 6-phosphate phosphatase
LNEPLDAIPGVRVERKRFSIAVHYRHGEEIGVTTVRQALNESARATASCASSPVRRCTNCCLESSGTKAKPGGGCWKRWGLERENVRPIFIGDDKTDEDAFRALKECGVGILVSDELQPTSATYSLKNPSEVECFLQEITDRLNASRL